ncbi:YIP1 family protein [Glaciecola siphonariae]|uniref:YIP1 family protein n=1 Tax=Glaciecola siphonariae TaxID=521012 RepID=A0ABV9LUA5_9ALTE
MQENNPQQVSNPIQAASEIFYKPTAVFDAIAVKDNWSWIPFILVTVLSIVPTYLYFNLVDFQWYTNMIATAQMPDASPAETEAFANAMELGSTQMISVIGLAIGLPIIMAILAGYYTLWTRNDEKSIHGFTDWYGAMWWIAMPAIINALASCIYLTLQAPGSEISQAGLAPLSLAFLAGIDMESTWFGLTSSLRIDSIWTILLGALCLKSWTNFSFNKSLFVSALPSVLIYTVTALFALG